MIDAETKMDDSESPINGVVVLGHYIRQKISQIPVIREHPSLSASQGIILSYLSEADRDIFQKDIEQHLSLRRSTVSGILDNMEAAGLIVRERVIADARLKRICITDLGRKLVTNVTTEINNIRRIMVSGISDDELLVFRRVVEKMKRNLMK